MLSASATERALASFTTSDASAIFVASYARPAQPKRSQNQRLVCWQDRHVQWIAVLVSFGIDLQKRFQHAPVQPKVQPNGGNLDFLRNQSQRKKRKRTVDNLSRLELGNAVLLGKFSDKLEKETNRNQRDSKATAPTHEPRMPDRSP